MQQFISSISGKSFPVSEKVSGRSVRHCIFEQILKEKPAFTVNDYLSLSEMNDFRNKYIQRVLENESGILSGMGKQLLENFSTEKTLSEKLMEQEERQVKLSFADKLSDNIASFGGSWFFIIIFIVVLMTWIIINTFFMMKKPFDPYPFILLNLVLSCIAALQAPLIMMSQNRQEAKDRNRAKNDYLINLKSELEVRMLHQKMDHLIINQQETLLEIQQVQIDMMNDILEKLGSKGH